MTREKSLLDELNKMELYYKIYILGIIVVL